MEWNKAKDKLPKKIGSMGFSEKVKVKSQEGNEFITFYDFWENMWNCNDEVIFWQPLDKPE